MNRKLGLHYTGTQNVLLPTSCLRSHPIFEILFLGNQYLPVTLRQNSWVCSRDKMRTQESPASPIRPSVFVLCVPLGRYTGFPENRSPVQGRFEFSYRAGPGHNAKASILGLVGCRFGPAPGIGPLVLYSALSPDHQAQPQAVHDQAKN